MMSVSVNRYKNKGLSVITALFMGVVVLLGLYSCSSSSDSTPPPDQDVSGLYNGVGTLNTQSLDDLIGMVNDNRIMLFSVTGNLVIDGTVSVTGNDFTGTVDVYKDGVLVDKAAIVSGLGTGASSIKGNITNSTVANGNFELTFDPLYDRDASLEMLLYNDGMISRWDGPSYSVEDKLLEMDVRTLTTFDGSVAGSCNYIYGTIELPSTQNLYLFTIDIEDLLANTCPINGNGIKYTGFGSIIDGLELDGKWLYVITNGVNSIFAILSIQRNTF